MSFVSTTTLIPLHRAAVHLEVDPYHFSQIYTSNRQFIPDCNDAWYQYGWQSSGKLSREGLALALRQAEDAVWSYLGWTALPAWHEEEVRPTPNYRTEMWSRYNSQGRAKSVRTQWGHVLETGKKTSALIDSPATVFSDPNGDGINELITITFATTVTDVEELHVYYPSKSGRDEWEIRPLISKAIAAGIATFTFPKYLIPLESLIVRPSSDDNPHIAIDGDVDANFLATVDVYRVYADPSEQVTYYFDPNVRCGTTPCADDTETGCLSIKDARLGLLNYTRADWDADTEAYTTKALNYPPMKLALYYRAGRLDQRQEYPYSQMNQSLERRIVFYALSLLDTELCGCSNTRNIWQDQTQDMSAVKPDGTRYVVPWGDLGNPLGNSRAAIHLWKYIQQIKISASPNPY